MQIHLFIRKIKLFGKFPFVRLFQIVDNPAYLFHIFLKNVFYKRDQTNYAKKYSNFKFISGQATLEHLITTGKSLSRFSDGEFDQITGGGEYPPDSNWSQKWSKSLQADLINVLSSINTKLLIAVDPPTTFLSMKKQKHAIPFEFNMWVDMRRLMWRFLKSGNKYGHSHLFIRKNCPDLNWGMLKNFLREKIVIIATGNINLISHLKIGKRTYFIECGTKNAYERKNSIKLEIINLLQNKNIKKKESIILLSLGPTATILASELLNYKIQAWDTGHIFRFLDKNLFSEN